MIISTAQGRRLAEVRRFRWEPVHRYLQMPDDGPYVGELRKVGIEKIRVTFNDSMVADALLDRFIDGSNALVVTHKKQRYTALIYSISEAGDVTLWLVSKLDRVSATA